MSSKNEIEWTFSCLYNELEKLRRQFGGQNINVCSQLVDDLAEYFNQNIQNKGVLNGKARQSFDKTKAETVTNR
jgi:hypothetical protein